MDCRASFDTRIGRQLLHLNGHKFLLTSVFQVSGIRSKATHLVCLRSRFPGPREGVQYGIVEYIEYVQAISNKLKVITENKCLQNAAPPPPPGLKMMIFRYCFRQSVEQNPFTCMANHSFIRAVLFQRRNQVIAEKQYISKSLLNIAVFLEDFRQAKGFSKNEMCLGKSLTELHEIIIYISWFSKR